MIWEVSVALTPPLPVLIERREARTEATPRYERGSSLTVNLCRPLARRLDNTLRPFLVAMRSRKP